MHDHDVDGRSAFFRRASYISPLDPSSHGHHEFADGDSDGYLVSIFYLPLALVSDIIFVRGVCVFVVRSQPTTNPLLYEKKKRKVLT